MILKTNDYNYHTLIYSTLNNVVLKKRPETIENYDLMGSIELFNHLPKTYLFRLARDCCETRYCQTCPFRCLPSERCIIVFYTQIVCKV